MKLKNIFTPIYDGRRKKYFQDDLVVVSGDLNQRGLGLHAVIMLKDTEHLYAVIGKSCDIEGCNCDAELIRLEEYAKGLTV
jgi:hypothetical protein